MQRTARCRAPASRSGWPPRPLPRAIEQRAARGADALERGATRGNQRLRGRSGERGRRVRRERLDLLPVGGEGDAELDGHGFCFLPLFSSPILCETSRG